MNLGKLLPTAGLAVALMLGVVGCGDDDPSVAAPPSPSPSVSETSTSESPASADRSKPTGPRDAIRMWVAASNEMQETGEVASYRKLVRRCESCRSFANQVAGIYEAGGWIEFEGKRVVKIRKLASSQPDLPVFRVVTVSGRTRFKESADGRLKRLPGGRVTHEVTVMRLRGAWYILDYVEVPT